MKTKNEKYMHVTRNIYHQQCMSKINFSVTNRHVEEMHVTNTADKQHLVVGRYVCPKCVNPIDDMAP